MPLALDLFGLETQQLFYQPEEEQPLIAPQDYTIQLPNTINVEKHRKTAGCTPAEIRKAEYSI